MKKTITINLLIGVLFNLLITSITQATSIYAEPSNGTTINFGNNVLTTAQASVSIFLTGGGDAKTQSNFVKGSSEVTDINCNFNGQDASHFSILTPMPAGPISSGDSLDIDLLANVYGSDALLTATLLCNYRFGTAYAAFTWPVQVSGVLGAPVQVQVIPSLNTVGIIVMALILLAGLLFSTSKNRWNQSI